MRTVRAAACLLAALLAAAGTLAAQEARILNGFNSDPELKTFRWSELVKTEVVREHATEGGAAVKVTFPADVKYRGFGFKDKALLGGWEKFDLLSFDVFNPGAQIVTVVMRIDDDRTDPAEWSTWYTGTFKMFPGENRIDIELAKLAKPHQKGRLNLARLKRFSLWVKEKKEPQVLFLDNLRLRRFAKTELPATLRAFDFGGEKSNVFPGFTLVTEKTTFDDARGFGFTDKSQRRSYSDAARAVEGLGVDSVGSDGKLSFAVKLPDGKYRLWAATGTVPGYYFIRKPYRVTVGAKEVFRFQPKTPDLRKTDPLAHAYRRNADVWDLHVPGHLFEEFEAEVNVTGGKLELTVASEGRAHLRALAVRPAGDAAAAKAMEQVRSARKDAFHKQWREIVPPRMPEPQTVTREESARGFMLASPNYLEPVTPYYVPTMREGLRTLAIAATPGELEPAVFVIYPLKDMKAFTVSVDALKGRVGTIPADAVKVHTVELRYVRKGEDAYAVEPVHLVPRTALDLERGVARQIWMEVTVPAKAAAGTYSGTVTVGAGASKAVFPLEVTVYPFTLDKPEDHGIVYAHVSRIFGDASADDLERDLRCLQRYGSNSVTPSNVIGGKTQGTGGRSDFNLDRLDLLMDVMKKIGMTGPVPLFDMSIQGYAGGQSRWHVGWQIVDLDSDWAANMTRMTAQIARRAKEKGYLPVLMYPSTEVSNDPGLGPAFNAKIIAAIRKGGEVQTISSVNRPEDIVTAKLLDHVMINFGVDLTQKTLDRIHAAGAKLWFQNVGQTRYTDGLFLLRAGAIGRRQWVAMWCTNDPFNDWDGRESNSLIFPSSMGTLPSVNLARMREGVDDLRYFLTLKRLIGEARKAGRAAQADAAEKEINAMIASCPVALPDGTRIMPDGLSVIEGFQDKGTFDRYRRRAAQLIIALIKLQE